MGKENLEIMMEGFMKVLFQMEKSMDQLKHVIKGFFLKESGKMGKSMELEKASGLVKRKSYKWSILGNTKTD